MDTEFSRIPTCASCLAASESADFSRVSVLLGCQTRGSDLVTRMPTARMWTRIAAPEVCQLESFLEKTYLRLNREQMTARLAKGFTPSYISKHFRELVQGGTGKKQEMKRRLEAQCPELHTELEKARAILHRWKEEFHRELQEKNERWTHGV